MTVLTVQQIAQAYPRVRGWTPWYAVEGSRQMVRLYIVRGRAIRTQVKR
jgi:hypothetical protein